jgi:PEP-CTERM motif
VCLSKAATQNLGRRRLIGIPPETGGRRHALAVSRMRHRDLAVPSDVLRSAMCSMRSAIQTALCAIALFGALSTAQATTYQFTQRGFAGGALVSGSFTTGADFNADGVFSTDVPGEITALQMQFSGNADVPAFTADTLTGTVAMTFWAATLTQRYFAYSTVAQPAPFSWDAAADGSLSTYYYSRVFGNPGNHVSYTDTAGGGTWTLNAVPVPEPATGLLAALGAMLLWGARRKRCALVAGAMSALAMARR